MKAIRLLAIATIFLFVLTGVASALSASILSVEINNDEAYPDDSIRLDVERASDLEIEVVISAWQDIDDVQITAFISGFEYSDFDSVSDSTHNFDMEANVSYKKRLTIALPEDMEEDDYKLRIMVADRYGDEIIENYNLKLDLPRHKLTIDDIDLRPGNSVKAGSALIASVRLDNKGDKDEDDVEVTVSIPELGISDSAYIDEIEYDEQEETEELYLRIPKCTEAGLYTLDIDVSYDNDHETLSTSMNIEVFENDACKAAAAATTVTETVEATPAETTSALRTVLETALIVLIALLVVVGLIIGFSRLKGDE